MLALRSRGVGPVFRAQTRSKNLNRKRLAGRCEDVSRTARPALAKAGPSTALAALRSGRDDKELLCGLMICAWLKDGKTDTSPMELKIWTSDYFSDVQFALLPPRASCPTVQA